jgi:class 3 adenylate cyclase
MAAKRFGGRIHSTAGDGVTCAFPHPQQAYGAARFIQAGLVELNAYRNKIGIPIRLRAGIHMGTVMVPPGQDLSKVNFAHVIDVSAHLQKAAPVGGIAISEEATRELPGGPTGVGAKTIELDSVRAYVWEPRAIEPAAGGPPSFVPPVGAPDSAPPFELHQGASDST